MDTIVESMKPIISSFGGGFNEHHEYKNGKIIITWSGSHYNYTDTNKLKSDLVPQGYKCK